ncbi:MAG: hypothetical protein KF725_15815 [Cyclobacteriaceae bacterium]|nr:hypothetical protein [Cyclobacteriaceae bacterium]UYN87804.1 MAG: hypothetical protein KIT51_05995 [Cyclobacteriaceae bacterium]
MRSCFVDAQKSFAGALMAHRRTVGQQDNSSDGNSILIQSGEATKSLGRSHISEEVFVMKMERRASVIQLEVFCNNPESRGRKTEENDKIITDQ